MAKKFLGEVSVAFHHLFVPLTFYLIQARKNWQRFREIPEWIDGQIKSRGISVTDAIQELEETRKVENKSMLLSMNALSTLLASRRKEVYLR